MDVISASLRDILNDLNHVWSRCKVCHQRKYFDQGGLSREREFGPGAFCPRRKCGAERDFKQGTQSSSSHVFSERLICVFSEGSSLTIALLLNSLGATGRVPGCHGISSSLQVSVDVTLKISREYCRKYSENIVENIRLSVRLARPRHGLVVGPEVCSGLPRWTHLDRGETGAAC